jgi:site-specific DNA recombinase
MSIEGTSPEATSRKRAAIYNRYSCNMQRPSSLEDQERNCRKSADEKGWIVVNDYVRGDAAKTGKMIHQREALDFLMTEAQMKPRPFDVLIVDEQSRLGRKLKDILELADILKHYGVKLYIVAQQLDSDDPNFQTLITMHGMIDEQNSERMRHRVLRGQEGRVRQGFASGSRCFGYRSVPVIDPTRPDLQGRAATLGCKWVVIESEAATIRRTYELYADGLSDFRIVLKFNQEGVVAARKSRIGPDHTTWNTSLVKHILQNEKYIGKVIWNRTTQVIHPQTGKTETRKNPPERWVHIDVPDLRIVSDELWNRVQERLKIVNERMTRRRIGGLNRAKKRDYIFSGLLLCGVCGSRITIGGCTGRASVYGCVSARYKRGCTNTLWIREDRLTAQLIQALATNLLAPEVVDYFIGAVSQELDNYLKGASRNRDGSFEDLKAREASLKSMISRLLETIMNPTSAHSSALPIKLAEVEAELEQVKNDLRLLNAPKDLAEAHYDLGAIVRENVSNLEEIIKLDAPKARQVLQRHIKQLILVPIVTEDGPVYEVIGEIDLFKSPTDRNGRILLARSGTGTVQQYAGHVDFLYRFAGLVVYFQANQASNLLLAPLTKLLESRPDLLHQPRPANGWSELIKSAVTHGSELHERINYGDVRWNFRNHAAFYVQRFGMVKIFHGRYTYYMFSRAGVTHTPADDGETESSVTVA